MFCAMGAIWTRIWGKPSTKDVLEKITAQLGDIEEFKRDTQAWHKKLIGYLLLYFSSLYFLAAAVVYFKFYHDPEWRHWTDQLKLFAPFLVAPLILWIVKRSLTWWYHRKLRKNEEKLDRLREEKSKILEEVMEKETYKVAKEILDKYGGGGSSSADHRQINKTTSSKMAPAAAVKTTSSALALPSPGGASDVRRRNTSAAGATANKPSDNLNASRQQLVPSSPSRGGDRSMLGSPSRQMTQGGPMGGGGRGRPPPPGPPLPRPVLPRERGYMDKVVEYLVGDGPSNRFALICKQCQSHNGMALREEFEYIAFRCCYCFYWNPARKQRPTAPRLPAGPSPLSAAATAAATASSTESTDDESSSAAAKPTVKPAAAVPQQPQPKPDTSSKEEENSTSKADAAPSEEKSGENTSSQKTQPDSSEDNSLSLDAGAETEVVSQAKENDEEDKKDN